MRKALKNSISVLFWLVVWQLAAMAANRSLLLPIPTPVDTARALCRMAAEGGFWLTLGASLLRICAGFALALLAGGAGAAAFLLGMIGGYPVGASTVAALVRRGDVSLAEGQRLLAFCNNAGPAFIIGVAGLTVFGSARVGAYLYLIHITAAAAAGVLLRGRHTAEAGTYRAPSRQSPLSAFLASVQGAASAMGRVCAFVVFFLVLLSLAETVTGALPPWAAGFLELTNGILRLSPTRSGFVTAAALLGWGGLSVHGQTASVLEGTGLSMTRYFAGKVLQAALSALLAWGAWHVMTAVA